MNIIEVRHFNKEMVFAECSAETIFIKSRGGIHMDQWLNMLSDVSFPILVSFYLLHRVVVKLDAIHDAFVYLK